jgi:DNA-binding MarR family transcriptional regulator
VSRRWRLTPAPSLVFAHLDADGTRPAELARGLGTTRQATADLVAGLVRVGVVEVVDDPASRRGRLVRLSADGTRLAAAAGRQLAGLETELGRRIGPSAVTRLRAALTADWGDPPTPT